MIDARPDRRVRAVADGFHFLEGPRWHDGALYVSDFYGHAVFAFEDGRQRTVCEVPNQPSGLGFAPDDGALLVVSMLDRRLLRLTGKRLEEVADMRACMSGPANDMVVDAHGRAYVGNFGAQLPGDNRFEETTLVRVDPDGSVGVAAEGLAFPNGAVLSEDGTTLLVAETFASRVASFGVAADGALGGRRVWAKFPSTCLPDGLALDAEGAVWVADAVGSGIVRVGEGGVVLDRVDTGTLAVYAAALGGPDRTTLYLCAAPPLGTSDVTSARRSVLLACDVEVPGAGRP